MQRRKFVIIMAAGNGTRMGARMPKQFLELGGKAILQRTVEVFLRACEGISIVTVLPKEHIDYWKTYCLEHNFVCPQILVAGGITRFHSVRNALAKIPEGALVAIHDGVRPLVTEGLVKELFSKAESCPAVIPVVPCVDTMKVLEEKDGVLKPVAGAKADRSVLFGAQTPQIFHSEIIKNAYSMAYDTSFTDDASVLEKAGGEMTYLPGERLNIKITTTEDLVLAQAVDELKK